MKSHLTLLAFLLLPVVFCVGCKKSTETPAAKPAPAATNPVATNPAPSSAPAPAGGDASASSAEAAAKMEATQWALKQDEIKNDPNGQWAYQVTSSSAYNDAQGPAGWSANQATGAPDVAKFGDDSHAWAPKTQDSGIEWLDLKYPKPVHATEVRVRESCGSGTVIKIEIFDEKGGAHAIWQGNDPTKDLNYLIAKFPKTDFKADRVKVTLATNTAPGWKEIDAVQLVGTEP